MNTVEFLSYLRSLDVQVSVLHSEGDRRLRCNAPEGVMTAALQRELAARKTEVIAFLEQAKANLQSSQPMSGWALPDDSLALAVSPAVAPLSFAQQRLWFLEQLVPGNPFYNVPTAMKLTGAVDLIALEQTFNEIVRRHDVLRTRFRLVDGTPVQAVLPTLKVELAIVDLRSSDLPPAQLMRAEAQRPFNLAEDPLLRVKLLRLGANGTRSDTESILLLTLHHIVADGWSMGVLIREIGALYAAFAAQQPSPLPPLPMQYAAFAAWQRNWMQGEVLAGQLNYWKQQLADLPLLDLPTDYPRPPVQSYRGATQVLPLSRALTSALESLSQQTGTTLFMILLAAFQTLLYRYTGQTDIVVGSPIANRNRREIEDLIGFFVNSLVLRTDLSGNPAFRALLDRVRSIAFAAYAHQDLPFERLVEELQPDRDLSRNPLFQVVFALQNAPSEPLNLPRVTLSPIEFDPGTTRFDLEFHVSPSFGTGEAALQVMAVYNTDLFAAETIARLLAAFQTLLESIVANPDQPIAELPILNQVERDRLIERNTTPYPKQCLHHQFEAQVDRTPQALALATCGQQLTYQDLNRRSNQVAHYLRSIGVTAETIVGVCVERPIDFVIALLGIWKAGGAYLPIDPAYPRDRIAFMLQDARALLLKSAPLADAEEDSRTVYLDGESIAQHSSENPTPVTTAENLAYLIYTSGSTGQPKGVLVEHNSLSNLVRWHQQAFGVNEDQRASQVAGVGFDACGWEIFPYLTAGASVHFPDREIRTSPPQLQTWLIQQEITVSFLPTPLAERIFALDWSTPSALRVLLTGGDTLRQSPPPLPFAVVNNYGLTETTVVATSGQVTNGEAPHIGKPIAGTQIYLLDAQMQAVPIGARGEIFIGGDSLARGYLDCPHLTARFVTSPLYGRLYRTGDLGRYRADGNLEFLGRGDEQVQIRGCRVELGEIASLLKQHPAVGEAIVTTAENVGELQIVAYVTPAYTSQSALQDEQVLQWQMLYEETYSQPAPEADPTFNRVGWNSSYTGQPLPSEQIREWVDRRVEQILAFQPQRVLEIGCGTGLLLFQLAPHCQQYWGTDFSRVSIDYIHQQLAQKPLPQVTLLERMAIDFTQIAPASFDAVILNSVVQYFPSIDYLIEVLAGAIEALTPGGFVFLGDIRSLPLLETLHTAIQFYQAEPSISKQELQQRIQTQIFQESELLIDPAFFHALRHRFPQIDRVQISLTRGRHHNEMTQFRYNVTLHVGVEAVPATPSPELNWTEEGLTLPIARQRLQTQPDRFTFRQIPNARLTPTIRVMNWLATADSADSIASCTGQSADGIDPEDLIALAQELSYRVALAPSDSNSAGRYDACFTHEAAAIGKAWADIETPQLPLRPWQDYANDPLRAKAAAHLVPLLRSYLSQKLPDFMLPGAIVVLEELPLTPNGKIDRKALPAPDRRGQTAIVLPRSPLEQQLAEIWQNVLGLKSIGTTDNFFELGGHSLLATQLVSRIRDAFQIELPLRTLFETPTIAQLAIEIERLQGTSQPQSAIIPLSRAAHRVNLASLHRPQADR